MRISALVSVVALTSISMSTSLALARTPAIATDSRSGVWIAAGESFIHQAKDRWTVYPAPATVNKLAVDDETVWIATDDGVMRFESASRRVGRLTMDDGLPSDSVTSVAVDDQFVWFGTNKGLVRYRKIDRTLRIYTDEDGLPHRAVNDIVVVGQKVWLATRAGLAVYDATVDGLRAFTVADGLASDYVAELYQAGDDLWCRTDTGLSRFQPASRRFTNFTFADLGGTELRVFVPDGSRIWVGTDGGLVTFESASDAFIRFAQQASLASASIRGVETFTDYLFITTDVEVVQYHKNNRTFRRFTAAEGITRQQGAAGTALIGGQLVILFADGAETYDIIRELWTTRSLERTDALAGDASNATSQQGGSSPDERPLGEQRISTWRAWFKGDAEVPIDLRRQEATAERYSTAAAGAGAGYQLEGGRSLDLTALLDYGELELSRVRDVNARAEYLGTNQDLVREVRLADKLELQTLEEGLERPLMLSGAQARVASPGDDPTVQATVTAGLRRGIAARDFYSGARQEIYNLSQRYVLPGSERVYLDGEQLSSGRDYTVIYTAGQLAFLDPERVDDLSVIEVEYEYDVMPRKGLGVISLLDLLPGDSEVGAWSQTGTPTLVREETGLYAQIDGAAPKYIDRGWVQSVYAEYQQASRTIRVAIHDMGNDAQAEGLYRYDLPPAREPVGDHDNVVLDINLAGAYAVKAQTSAFYIELSIDEKSDPAKQSIKLFALQILDRSSAAGAHQVDEPHKVLATARAAVSPLHGLELGARVLELATLDDQQSFGRGEQLTSIVDARYERALEQGGRLTAYAEAARSHHQSSAAADGWGAMGNLRLSHPWIEGAASARFVGPGYAPLGSNATLYGTLRDELRFTATAYPTRWLPATVFFTRQVSNSHDPAGDADGTDRAEGTAVMQHALARLQLTHPNTPATSVQLGHSLLQDAHGAETSRLKVVGQTDYDLADGILKGLGMRRAIVRGLYGLSDATTRANGYYGHGDRVEVIRGEAKLAPTTTESAYALFRSRTTKRNTTPDGEFELQDRHWELNAGAYSSIVPGLIPQVIHSVIFNDDRRQTASVTRSSSATLAGQLGIYPGDWLAALAPVNLESRYSLSEETRSNDGLRTLMRRLDRLDNRFSYNGMGKVQVELYGIYEVGVSGRDRERDSERLELRNRFIYRPTHTSPITLRLDRVRQRSRNDRTLAPQAPRWGRITSYEAALEWLMRWNSRWTTKLTGTYSQSETIHLLVADAGAGAADPQSQSSSSPAQSTTQSPATSAGANSFVQHQVKPELELRYLLQQDTGSLYAVQRTQVYRTFGTGDAATQALGTQVSLGFIWIMADHVYLDVDVGYSQVHCLERDCVPTRQLVPRLTLTAEL